jgi:hypothetical protein
MNDLSAGGFIMVLFALILLFVILALLIVIELLLDRQFVNQRVVDRRFPTRVNHLTA